MSKTIDRWTKDEMDLMSRYFTSAMTDMKLYENLSILGTGRTYEAMSRKLRYMRSEGWIKNKDAALKKLRVGYLDIETTNLAANFGIILCWYIKEKGKEKYDFGCVTKQELFDFKEDKRIVAELLDALKNYDVIYTHYGADRRFDIPFIRTRAIQHGLEDKLPKYMEKFIFDTWLIAKNKLRLHSNRLDVIAEACNIKTIHKTPLSPSIWNKARYGHPESMKYVMDHNKQDVRLLEAVHAKLEFVERPIYKSI